MDRGIGWWLTKHAVNSASRTALVQGERRRTYAELNARADQLSAALYAAGVRHGDRVASLALNGIEHVETLFAVAKLGAIFVPNNYRLSGEEVAYNLSDSGAVVLVVSSELASLAAAALAVPGVHVRHVVSIGGTVPEGTDAIEYEAFLASGSTAARDDDVSIDDLALIMYTSGTTGRPKGAVITHATIQTNAVHAVTMGPGLSRDDVTTTPAPLFHIGGLMVHTLPLLYVGGRVVLLEGFDATGTLTAMAQERATVQFLVPAMWHAITRHPDFASFDLSALRFCLSGGAPCPITVIEFLQGHGWQFLEGFGMTETCANTMALSPEDAVRKQGSVGRPMMHAEAKIVDDDDREVRVGTVGELVMRGPSMFRGYWGLPVATAEAWRGGWFHSGDLGKVDDEGFYTLVDRKKDMVITGGENVYPIEVEQVLFRHPSVADVAVIGVPDERWGEAVVAVVVAAPGAEVDQAELVAYARERLAHFKCPRRVEVLAELPRTATGKVLKRELRKTYTGQEQSVTR
ncbi:MAG: o-succinylbenzoate--CoA ligase [Frankiales bacterium]|jgi:fatty-acyl-CoA synthase|nr:o-succinylbenzoate--CoA ligase [Frankiales bacterium]